MILQRLLYIISAVCLFSYPAYAVEESLKNKDLKQGLYNMSMLAKGSNIVVDAGNTHDAVINTGSNNTVINNGTINGDIIGGKDTANPVSNNTVTLGAGSTTKGSITGGQSNSNLSANTVNINGNGGTVSVLGSGILSALLTNSEAHSINVENNSLNINNIKLNHNGNMLISSVKLLNSGNVNKNTVNINNLSSTAKALIMAVKDERSIPNGSLILRGNSISVTNSHINNSDIHGVLVKSFNNNKVSILGTNLTIKDSSVYRVIGVEADLSSYGSRLPNNPADTVIEMKDNTILLDKVTSTDRVEGGLDLTDSSNNKIIIRNSTIGGMVTGFDFDKIGKVSSLNDTIIIEGSTLKRFLHGIEVDAGDAYIDKFTLYFRDTTLQQAFSGILNQNPTGSTKGPVISHSNIVVAGNEKTSIGRELKGIDVNLNGSNIFNNNLVIGYDTELNKAGMANLKADVSGVYSEVWQEGTKLTITGNNLYIGGALKSDGSHGVIVNGSVYGINAKTPYADISNNHVLAGINLKDHSPLNAQINGNLYGAYTTGGGSIDHNGVYILGNVNISGQVYGAYYSKTGSYIPNTSPVDMIGNFVDIGVTDYTQSKLPVINLSSSIYGAYHEGDGVLSQNIVTIDGEANINGSVYAAFGQGDNKVTKNSVIIEGIRGPVTINGDIYAGLGKTGSFTNNSVIVQGNSNIKGSIYAAKGESTNSFSGNSVTLNGLNGNINITGSVYGSYNNTMAAAQNNSLDLEGNISSSGSLYAAYGTSSISRSSVTIGNNTGTTNIKTGSIYAGYTTGSGSNLINNTVNITGATTVSGKDQMQKADIYAAYLSGNGSLSNNSIVLSSNSASGIITGGHLYSAYTTGNGLVSNNMVSIKGKNEIDGDTYAGYSSGSGSSLIHNNIFISGKVVVNSNLFAAYGQDADLDGNAIFIGSSNKGEHTDIVLKNIYAGYNKGNGMIHNNSINIIGSTNISADGAHQNLLYAAYGVGNNELAHNQVLIGEVVDYDTNAKPIAESNTLKNNYTVNVEAKGIYGAYNEGEGKLINNSVIFAANTNTSGDIFGAYNKGVSGTLENNQVILEGNAHVTGSIYGAYAEGGVHQIDHSTVVIGAIPDNKGVVQVTGDIYGGYNKDGGDVLYNKVVLIGDNDLSKSTVYGGYTSKGVSKGHILELKDYKGFIKDIKNFDKITFDNYNWQKDAVIVTLTGTNITDLTKTNITQPQEILASNLQKININDRMHLIHSNAGIEAGSETISGNKTGIIRQGFARIYKYNMVYDKNNIDVVINSWQGDLNNPLSNRHPAAINPQLESLLGGRDALALMVKGGADMVSLLKENIIRKQEADDKKPNSIGTFIVSGGGYVQDKGHKSIIELYRGTVISGIDANFNRPIADTFLSAFFEGGYGTFKGKGIYEDLHAAGTEYRFYNIDSNGSTSYYGAGVALRSDFKIKSEHTIYIDTAFRGGMTEYNYYSSNFINENTEHAEYKSKTPYYGTHIGLGYMYNLNDKYVFDVYGRYLFSYYDADTVNVHGDVINFNSFLSHRFTTGARVNFLTKLGITPYIGAGFEYQADEKVGGITYGGSIKGHESILDYMGTFEAGFMYEKAFDKFSLNLDIKAEGSVGALNSGIGSANIRFNF